MDAGVGVSLRSSNWTDLSDRLHLPQPSHSSRPPKVDRNAVLLCGLADGSRPWALTWFNVATREIPQRFVPWSDEQDGALVIAEQHAGGDPQSGYASVLVWTFGHKETVRSVSTASTRWASPAR